MTEWADDVVERTVGAIAPLADPDRAAQMAAYMRHVAPFLGIGAPARRAAQRSAWAGLASPTSDELGAAAARLFELPGREHAYAGADLIARFRSAADESFLPHHVTPLLVSTPWWDTVDALGSAAVSPLCRRFDHRTLIDAWSDSGDRWLVRAAIQHQRGWAAATDVSRVLGLCDRHWADPEFFVAKAIGWALRDLTRIEPDAVTDFLAQHPSPNRVAEREARRGLARVVGRPSTGHDTTLSGRAARPSAIRGTATPSGPSADWRHASSR
jgi:3-methyladenine DNA glycosylase AlkD